MSDDERWDVIDKIPDPMPLQSSKMTVPQPLDVWRDALDHPWAHGHGYCKTCGAGGPCILMAFHDAVMMSTVRELDKAGALVPRKENETP